MPLGSPAEDHLAELFDRGISSLQQFHQSQYGSEQSLDFIFGALIQIGISNLLDQMLDFSRRGSRDLFSVGHLGRSSSRNNINNQIDLHLSWLSFLWKEPPNVRLGRSLLRVTEGTQLIPTRF